ncbi:ATP-dependent nuclease [Mycobacterium marinum]|uniref:ATP-dependent nuclease n=1 Tax=Mycobacterium marinum TaxID=1781 RepID=UPI0023599083|nr:AAA family ATPase [Mycobacterium marinum]MDC9003759.1 AAA family ATPase [Mycobacterium marinum]
MEDRKIRSEYVPPVDGPTGAADGDAEKFKFGINAIRIGDGDMLDLGGPGSVTVVVGANNVGKTKLLEQLVAALEGRELTQSPTPRIVTEISDPWQGSDSMDLEAWIRANSTIRVDGRGASLANRPYLNETPVAQFGEIRRKFATPSGLTRWFVQHLSGSSYWSGVQSVGRTGKVGAPPTHPFHVLHTQREKLERLKRITKRLFGVELYLDTVSAEFTLRMGEPTAQPYFVDTYDPVYDASVAALPEIRSQGDGIRSALGLLVKLITNLHPLVLLDEPEAFLHPPQARIIGQEIGKQAKGEGAQVIVATHDKGILQGIVESEALVTILHLTREGDTALAKALEPEHVRELWKDPILRYSNALDGLFHSAVIVTEDERDAHFYNAAIDSLLSADAPDAPAHNIMFLGASGKTNLARIAGRLCKLGVQTVSCPDLDILNDMNVLRKLVEAHEGDWDNLNSDYTAATNEFKQSPPAPTVAEIRERLKKLLGESVLPNNIVTKDLADKLAEVVRLPRHRWKLLKDYGFEAFKQDKAAASRLLDALDRLGIVTLRIGILENFVKTKSPSKGASLLSDAFAENAHKSADAVSHAMRLLRAAGVEACTAE